MMRFAVVGIVVLSLIVIGLAFLPLPVQSAGGAPAPQAPAYGGAADFGFAVVIWSQLADYRNWIMKSDYFPGKSPHGSIVRVYYNMVTMNGVPHHVILKENFSGGDSVAPAEVAKDPAKYLKSITVQVEREPGYDPDNRNWFWVQYKADGTVSTDEKGMPLAGRIAKGQTTGCIACHANAKGKDYLFTNDQ
jgi:hypothetical protein